MSSPEEEIDGINQIEDDTQQDSTSSDENYQDADEDLDEYNIYFAPDDNDDDEEEDFDDTDEDEHFHVDETNDDYENVEIPAVITYNTDLPSNHEYLGQNFQDVSSSKQIHDSNDEIQVPLLTQPSDSFFENDTDNSVQLIPGQVMPIYFYSPIQIQVIRKRLSESNPTIGFSYYPKLLQNRQEPIQIEKLSEDFKLGIIAEIISASYHNENNEIIDFSSLIESAGGLILKVKGCERFKILKIDRDITGTAIGTVKILPEYVLNINPLSRQCPKNVSYIYDNYLHKIDLGLKTIDVKAIYFNTMLNQPPWVYRNFDCDYLIYSIKKELNETFKIHFEDPENKIRNEESINGSNNSKVFCSWLLTNFPFDNKMRLNTLKMNCINQRLSYMYCLLKKFTNINCRLCDEQFCTKSDVFSMSKHGFMDAYLNPGGVVHETLTVYKLKNFLIVSLRPSTQHSWFPGYAWQIITCGRCNNHIGWKFTMAKPDLKPEKFFGLTRKAIRYAYRGDEENEIPQAIETNSQTERT